MVINSHLHVINDTSCNKYPTGLIAVSNKDQLNYQKMTAREEQNIRVFLRSRPGESNPVSVENFGTETVAIPECKQGEIVAKTLCLSVDPYMRVRFNADSGVAYAISWQIGQTFDGSETGVVMQSKDESYQPGDIIHLPMCWPFQKFVNFNPQALLLAADPRIGLHALQKVKQTEEYIVVQDLATVLL